MKRQERNSNTIMARLASSTRHLFFYTIPAFYLRFVNMLTLRFSNHHSHASKNMRGGRSIPDQEPVSQGGAYHATYDRPYPEEFSPVQDFAASRTALLHQRSLHVALLDDNPAILDFLATALAVDGHTGTRYTEGRSLLDALLPPASSAHTEDFVPPYDLVILDLLLPGSMSGADIFLAIRKRFSVEQLPIIVITAVDELTLQQFRHILPDDVPLLRKPFPPRVLRSLIAQLTGDDV